MNNRATHHRKALGLSIFLLTWFCFIAIRHPVPYDNVLSRWDLTKAIVYEGKFCIDTYHENTHDKAVYQGHYFTDKAIGGSLLGAAVLWGWISIKTATGMLAPEAMDLYVVRALTVSLASALMCMLCFFLALRLGLDFLQSSLTALLLGLGTMVFPYSTMFYGNQFASALAFCAFYLGDLRIERETSLRQSLVLSAAGFLTGAAALVEFPAGLIAILITGYMAVNLKRKSRIIWFIVGGFPSVALMLYYNYVCFDDPFKLSYSFKYGQHFVDIHTQGFMGVARFSPEAFWGITLSPAKGIFYLAPFLLITLLGLVGMVRCKPLRRYGIFFLTSVAAYVLFNASFVDWPSGWTYGPRHMIPMVPYLALGWAGILASDGLVKSRLGKGIYYGLFLGLGLISSVFAFLAVITNPHAPTDFNNIVTEFLIPLLKDGYFSSNIMLTLGVSEAKAHIVWLLFVVLFIFLLLRKAIEYDRIFRSANSEERPLHRRASEIGCLIPSLPALAISILIYVVITVSATGEATCNQRKSMALVLMHNDLYEPAARELKSYLQWCPATEDDRRLYFMCERSLNAGLGK